MLRRFARRIRQRLNITESETQSLDSNAAETLDSSPNVNLSTTPEPQKPSSSAGSPSLPNSDDDTPSSAIPYTSNDSSPDANTLSDGLRQHFIHRCEMSELGSPQIRKLSECPVYLLGFDHKEKINTIHVYHKGCAKKWLRKEATCAQCNVSLKDMLEYPEDICDDYEAEHEDES